MLGTAGGIIVGTSLGEGSCGAWFFFGGVVLAWVSIFFSLPMKYVHLQVLCFTFRRYVQAVLICSSPSLPGPMRAADHRQEARRGLLMSMHGYNGKSSAAELGWTGTQPQGWGHSCAGSASVGGLSGLVPLRICCFTFLV